MMQSCDKSITYHLLQHDDVRRPRFFFFPSPRLMRRRQERKKKKRDRMKCGVDKREFFFLERQTDGSSESFRIIES